MVVEKEMVEVMMVVNKQVVEGEEVMEEVEKAMIIMVKEEYTLVVR